MLDKDGAPRITKDGVTVAKEIELPDKFENMGAQMVREVATRTSTEAGDGTTAAVLAQAIDARERQGRGRRPEPDGPQARHRSRGRCRRRRHQEPRAQGHDQCRGRPGRRDFGQWRHRDRRHAGQGHGDRRQRGRDHDRGQEPGDRDGRGRGHAVRPRLHRPYFVTNAERMVAEFEDAYILLHEKKLSNLQAMPVLEAAVQTSRPLLIIAEDVEGEVLATLVVNKLRGGLKIAAVKAPGSATGARRCWRTSRS